MTFMALVKVKGNGTMIIAMKKIGSKLTTYW
jgi:hypothetical protein